MGIVAGGLLFGGGGGGGTDSGTLVYRAACLFDVVRFLLLRVRQALVVAFRLAFNAGWDVECLSKPFLRLPDLRPLPWPPLPFRARRMKSPVTLPLPLGQVVVEAMFEEDEEALAALASGVESK